MGGTAPGRESTGGDPRAESPAPFTFRRRFQDIGPTNTFAPMLRTDLDPTRKKCAFTVFLGISSKTTDGDYIGA